MAAPKRKKKKPAPGGPTGAPPRSEPRIQVFTKFGGCNFQMSPHAFDYVFPDDGEKVDEQTDLMSNLMVVQNNAVITPNMTIETRPELIELFVAPNGKLFTGVATVVGTQLYAATNDGEIHKNSIWDVEFGGYIGPAITLSNHRTDPPAHDWTYLGHADDKLVGMTAQHEIWTADDPMGDGIVMHNAKPIANPAEALSLANLTVVPAASMTIGDAWSTTNKYRVTVQYTYTNMFGPTEPSDPFTFYASKPPADWTVNAGVAIKGSTEPTDEIDAVEIYYSEGEFREPNFLGRAIVAKGATETLLDGEWEFHWGVDNLDPSSWLVANLTLPTENHTAGVPATRMASHDGQLYFWGGNPAHRIWMGGNMGNRFSVSPGTGGGFVDCEPGMGTAVRDVLKFKTTQGASIVTALCDNPNSQHESRFNLVESTLSLTNEQTVKSWLAEKVAGTVGCKSTHGAVVAADGLYAISRYGLAVTTLTMEYNGQLRVQFVSDAIEPVFLKQYGTQLTSAHIFAVNDILYMTFGKEDGTLDNVIFCYDIDRMAWWTYTLEFDKPILGMFQVDSDMAQEGIGIVVEDAIFLLPTTMPAAPVRPIHEILIESAELTTMQPVQNMHTLAQLELRFDYFVGDLDIIVQMVDQFGRKLEARKKVSHQQLVYGLAEHIRIDQTVESYKLILKGQAAMRLTHFISKNYPKSARIGMTRGFDSMQTGPAGSIHRTFKSYNDVRDAIIP